MKFESFYMTEAGIKNERQEIGIIDAINQSVEKSSNGVITIEAGSTKIRNVVSADKYPNYTEGGKEPLTDIILTLKNGKMVNISAKGTTAPTLAGGGKEGIETIMPGFLKKYFDKAYKSLKSRKVKPGSNSPDFYFKLSDEDSMKLLIGNKSVGGPIDFMYVGKMDVNFNFDETKNLLTFDNGQLIDVNEFLSHLPSGSLYVRFRKRREDQRIDYSLFDKFGMPRIFGVSPSKGDVGARVVITSSTPSTAIVFND